jgi:hypothetical protein
VKWYVMLAAAVAAFLWLWLDAPMAESIIYGFMLLAFAVLTDVAGKSRPGQAGDAGGDGGAGTGSTLAEAVPAVVKK